MEPFKLALMIIVLSVSVTVVTTKAGGLNSEEENLSTHLITIGKLISSLTAQKNSPSFDDITTTSVKQVKSMLVKVIDREESSSSKRHLMLETIKDLQRVEDWLADEEPVIRQIQDYCEALIEKQLFKNKQNKVTNVTTVLKYLEELNTPDKIDKTKLKREFDRAIEVLSREARHMPEIEKLIDYLEVRGRVLDGVLDMDRYLERRGFTIADLHELHNITQEFAPFIDRLFQHKGAVNHMNSVYTSLAGGGDKVINNAEDAKKMSFMLKLDMFSSMEKAQHKSTKWSKLIEELKLLNSL